MIERGKTEKNDTHTIDREGVKESKRKRWYLREKEIRDRWGGGGLGIHCGQRGWESGKRRFEESHFYAQAWFCSFHLRAAFRMDEVDDIVKKICWNKFQNKKKTHYGDCLWRNWTTWSQQIRGSVGTFYPTVPGLNLDTNDFWHVFLSAVHWGVCCLE